MKSKQGKKTGLAAIVAGWGFVCILCFLLFQCVYAVFPPCEYTEKRRLLPEKLENATLVLTKSAYQAVRDGEESQCTPTLSKTANEIVGVSRHWTEPGSEVKPLPAGEKYTLEDVYAEYHNGIYAIDSGPGPINFLILRNQETGTRYKLAAVYLVSSEQEHGYDKSNVYIEAYDTEGQFIQKLYWAYFRELWED